MARDRTKRKFESTKDSIKEEHGQGISDVEDDSSYENCETEDNNDDVNSLREEPTIFQVKSGAICYGTDNNIRYGASQPIQTPQPAPFSSGGGTVLAHNYEFNVSALNGTWRALPLVSTQDQSRIVAWFAHQVERVPDAFIEIQRILSVANSPYEMDNGTNRNTEETWEGRVLVINRYDWCGYDNRGSLPPSEEDDDDEQEEHYVNYAALVDYEHASSVNQNEWYSATSADQNRGVYMPLHEGMEYSFGRFGLTEDRRAALSFLFFASDTPLANHTCLLGDDRPIYVPLTHEERHAFRLATDPERYYSGFSFVRQHPIPPTVELLGPFTETSVIDALQVAPVLEASNPRAPRIEPQLQAEVVDLLNNCICGFVYQGARVAKTVESIEAFNDRAFPVTERTGRRSRLDEILIERMVDPEAKSMILHSTVLEQLITNASSDDGVDVEQPAKLLDFYSIAQLTRGIRYLLGEVLEMAGNCALDNHRSVIVPYDIRISMANDPELFPRLCKHAKLHYPPDMWPNE